MYESNRNTLRGQGKLLFLLSVFIIAQNAITFASDKHPNVEKKPLSRAVFRVATNVGITAAGDGVSAVTQSEVAAPIYRSTSCGQQRWIGGQPSWLDQLILFNDGESGAPLRSMTFPVCYDGCHVQNRCVGQGGAEDCDCLAPGDLPFNASFQLYDGNPCDGGIQIAGAGGMVTVTAGMILDAEIGDGQMDCFDLTVDFDPKVMIPHEVWVEANFGHDDAWPPIGHPTTPSSSPLSGLNDGVDCTTFCDRGASECQNDPDGCDWFLTNMDSNAEIIFTLQPVPPPAETKWAAMSSYTVVDNEAIMPQGGDRVFFDVMVSDFDPGGANGTQIRAFQTWISADGYNSGLTGTLALANSDCLEIADCEVQMGHGSFCGLPLAPNSCAPAYGNLKRSDHLFFDQATTGVACEFGIPDFRCAAVLIVGGVGSPGRDSYLWTLVLDVPQSARGTFTTDLKLAPDTLLLDISGELLPFVGVVPGKITIPAGRCCYDLDAPVPQCANALLPNECDALPGPRTFLLDAECDGSCAACLPSSRPTAETVGADVVAKNRFLSIEAGDPGRLQALRVTAVSLPPPYDAWNGRQWFAGKPVQVCENSSQGLGVSVENCGPAPGLGRRWFWAVPLFCNEALAHYTDWNTLGLVNLFHEGIVPSRLVAGGGEIAITSLYDVQVIDRNCDSGDAGNFSDPLSITQAAWGDVVKNCMECPCGVPDFRVDVVTDAISVIQKFANTFCAPSKSRVDIVPEIPNFRVNILDVLHTDIAFSGGNYPFAPGDPCE